MSARPIKILLLEDNPADAELILRHIRDAGFDVECQRIDSEAAYKERLKLNFDLILSDFQMPQFDALRALALLQQADLDIPFILISGTIGEDTAVQAMKLGAADYLLKDRLARLGTAVGHALEQSALRQNRRQNELALQESERRHRLMFENNPAPMWVYEPETLRFLAINQAAVNHYGYSRDEFLAMTIRDIRPAEELPALESRLSGALDVPSHRTWRHRKKDGTFIQVAITSHQIPFAGRLGQLVMATDITARTEAEERLRASELRLRTVTDNARVGLVMVNEERRYTFANATYGEFLGLGPREIVGEAVAEVLPALYESQIRPRLDQAFSGERVEYELQRPAGEKVRHFTVRYEPAQHDGSGRTALVIVVITDITARKLAEESLRASEERFRGALDSLIEGCQILDHELRFRYINEAAARHGHHQREELLGRRLIECYPGFEQTTAYAQLQRCLRERTSARVEDELVLADGTKTYFELSIHPVPEGLFVLSLDTTERRLAGEKIREQLGELLRWQEVMLGREDRVQALKAEVNALLAEQGKPARYAAPAIP
ncbi:MAG: PAS domain S-box protein [Verrucomicrobia bacterium]|nr:PAS domain S-box protein [Verrucomicrobiota bacterium]